MKKLSKEEEELLFKDLSQRLHYKVKCNVYGRIGVLTGLNDYGSEIDYGNGEDTTCEIQYCLPYLRPMSSMTKEEKAMYEGLMIGTDNISYMLDVIDWLNAHHFDYRGLIEKDLAISTEEFNPYE